MARGRGLVEAGMRRSLVGRRGPGGGAGAGSGGARSSGLCGGAAKMAASGWARAALVLLCASDLLLPPLPPRASAAEGAAGTPGEASQPPRKKKKDIRDYNDADMARLLEQWEVRARAHPRASLRPGPGL